jgi:N-methylhydantoinase B/oxoprolinase/acetone carboxylase alpha subunit
MDSIELEILWSNLTSIVTEQARALQRVAFSPIVREAGDLATALFDSRARVIAQTTAGTPGHINSLAAAGATMAERFRGKLDPGDVLVTNDPWIGAGHFFDITVLAPAFMDGKLIGFAGATAHHTDIGGYGLGAGARDVHEEGLWIPPAKLYEAGKPNALLHDIIRHNVRTPDYVFGDLAAQVSSCRVGADRLIAICRTHGLPDLKGLADEIISISESSTRRAIRQLRSGTAHAESKFDTPGGELVRLKVAVTVDAELGEITVDFAGSSAQSKTGINVVRNYTHAYAAFAVRACLNPEVPNNHGSLAPIKISAPEGCIVNCSYPAPVNARHVVGMYVPMPILKALYHFMPERVMAEGAGSVWTVQVQGSHEDGKNFVSSVFNYSGGMGARAGKPGLSATCFPAGVSAVPVEILEAAMPIVFSRKELRRRSGGAGTFCGGDGQVISFRMNTKRPWVLNVSPACLKEGPEGLAGGTNGLPGRCFINGEPFSEAGKINMEATDDVVLETPGGAGYGPDTSKL